MRVRKGKTLIWIYCKQGLLPEGMAADRRQRIGEHYEKLEKNDDGIACGSRVCRDNPFLYKC